MVELLNQKLVDQFQSYEIYSCLAMLLADKSDI